MTFLFNPCGASTGAVSMHVGTTAPPNPAVGAFWIDTSNPPATPQLKVLVSPGNWLTLSQGAQTQLPDATQAGQVLVSQTGTTTFPWAPEDGVIEGTY